MAMTDLVGTNRVKLAMKAFRLPTTIDGTDFLASRDLNLASTSELTGDNLLEGSRAANVYDDTEILFQHLWKNCGG